MNIFNFFIKCVLTAVYFLVLTPIGLVRRLFGVDDLQKHFDKSISSYWLGK